MSDRSLEFKQGMGCVALLLLGLPSAGIGIGVLLSLFSAHQRRHHGDFVGTGFTILFGLLFLVIGLYIIFWRAGVMVDGERRSFEDWDGFLWLRRSECHPFSDFDAMVVRGGKSKKTFLVKAEGIQKDLLVTTAKDHAKAVELAARVSLLTGLGMKDTSLIEPSPAAEPAPPAGAERSARRSEPAASPEGIQDISSGSQFVLVLTDVPRNKISVIKAVREIAGLDLKEAKELVETAPKPVKAVSSREEAERLQRKLSEAGASVELKRRELSSS